ncbi:MAG: hypothetical protein PHU94_01780 [Bacilli bacterium]|nr:hypothetical protein [Bacilli bacterium]MDD4734247.1 hypothetical protein [Bacilli bacterium]
MKKVGIVSCDKWINKIKEDLYLNKELISLGINSNLISWEDQSIDYSEYDCLIVRSIWGYQDKLEKFYEWLEQIKQNQIRLFNTPEIIESNIRKDVQFSILKKHNISVVKTEFIYEKHLFGNISSSVLEVMKKQFVDTKLFVVKPIISGSGNNTYLVDLEGYSIRPNNVRIEELDTLFNGIIMEQNNGLMIQPFISEIDNGEISCVFIEGQNTHNIRRYPSVFHEKKKQQLETSLSSDILELAKQVEAITEYNGYLYMRVDMVEQNGKLVVMEVELTEPDLLTRYMSDEIREPVIKTFAKRIEKRLVR